MKNVLKQISSEKKMQSVLSATDQTNLDIMMTHYGLTETFHFIYGVDNKLAGSKIERGLELIRNSGIEKSESIIIGDTLHDLEVGQALGIDAVLISHGHQCPTRLRLLHAIECLSQRPRDSRRPTGYHSNPK